MNSKFFDILGKIRLNAIHILWIILPFYVQIIPVS
jgi:hypothetical protein